MMRNDHNFKIRLKNKFHNLLDLNYTLLQNPSAQIWFNCLKSSVENSFVNSTRFYNFKNRTDLTTENLVQNLETTICALGESLPELGKIKLSKESDSNLQKSLNELHTNFAHSHLIEKSITQNNLELWAEFNSLIHQIESALIAKNLNTKLNISRIEFTWKDNFQTAIPEFCYGDFTLQKPFGSLQINYCQVGRHLHELYFAQDHSVPVEHIQPQRFFSANSTLWFGPDLTEKYEVETTAKIHDWFQTKSEKFNAAGIHWHRKDKALGSVTVAQLNQKFSSVEEKIEFQNRLSEFTEVAEVTLST